MSDTTKKVPVGLFVGLGVALIAVIWLFSTYTSAVAYGAQQERAIDATWQNNKQILGTYTTKIAEMAQVPAMARNDLAKVMQASLSARYGEQGSQAAVQWIRESYPGQVDPKLYQRLQATMEAGRTEFSDNQTKLLDQKREYLTHLDYVVQGFWLKLAGYPKMDMDKFNVVTSTSAEQSFSTGVDDGVKLPNSN